MTRTKETGMTKVVSILFVLFLGAIVTIILIGVASGGLNLLSHQANSSIGKVSAVFDSAARNLFGLGDPYEQQILSYALQWWVCIAPEDELKGELWDKDKLKCRDQVQQLPDTGLTPKCFQDAAEKFSKEKLDQLKRRHPITEVDDQGNLTLNSVFVQYFDSEEKRANWQTALDKPFFDNKGPKLCPSIALAVVSHSSFLDRWQLDHDQIRPDNKHVQNMIYNLSSYQKDQCQDSGIDAYPCALRLYNEEWLGYGQVGGD